VSADIGSYPLFQEVCTADNDPSTCSVEVSAGDDVDPSNPESLAAYGAGVVVYSGVLVVMGVLTLIFALFLCVCRVCCCCCCKPTSCVCLRCGGPEPTLRSCCCGFRRSTTKSEFEYPWWERAVSYGGITLTVVLLGIFAILGHTLGNQAFTDATFSIV